MADQKNIGEQIGDAIQEAIAGQDFSQLQQTVKRGIDFAAKSINAGLAQAAQASREAQEAARTRASQPQPPHYPTPQPQRTRAMGRFGSSTGLKLGGYFMAIGGGIIALSLLLLTLVCFAGSSVGIPGMLESDRSLLGSAAGIFLVFTAIFTGLAVFGGTRIGLAGRFSTYQRIIGTSETVTVEELARRSGKSTRRVLKDLRKMTARGMFPEGRLSEDDALFFVTDAAFARFEAERRAAIEKQRQQALEREAATKTADGETISPEAQAILQKGYAYIEQIRERNAGIPGEEVSQKISQIESIVDSIFKRAKEHPEVIDDLDQLLDYYLPVTVKLLDAYEDLDSQPIQSESIVRSKREIEDTLDTLNTAFAKLLDSIFKDMTWDVSTDISVLHTVLAQEGLTDNPFENRTGDPR